MSCSLIWGGGEGDERKGKSFFPLIAFSGVGVWDLWQVQFFLKAFNHLIKSI